MVMREGHGEGEGTYSDYLRKEGPGSHQWVSGGESAGAVEMRASARGALTLQWRP